LSDRQSEHCHSLFPTGVYRQQSNELPDSHSLSTFVAVRRIFFEGHCYFADMFAANFPRPKRQRSLIGHLSDEDDLPSSADSLISTDDQEEQTTVILSALARSESMRDMTTSGLHPLLIADIADASRLQLTGSWSNVSSQYAVFSRVNRSLGTNDLLCFRPSPMEPELLHVTIEFQTTHIDTETACQWQICNQQSLACQLVFNSGRYLNEPGESQRKCCV
jgi:hypothetical protein